MVTSGEKTALFVSSAAAIAAALAVIGKKAQAAGGGATDETALLELLAAIAQNTQAILDKMGVSGEFTGYPPNAKTFLVGQLQCQVAAQPYNIIPAYVIPDDFTLVLKSHPGNPAGSLLYIADSAGNATNIHTAWPLMANESIRYKIKQTDSIWVASNIAPAFLCYTLEYNG